MRTHTSQPLSRDDRGFRTDALQLRNQLQGWTVEVEQERISVFSPGRNHFFGRWQQVGFQPIESFEIMFFFRTSSITSEKLSRARTLSQTQQPDIQDVNPRWTLIPRLFHCGDYNISSKVIRFFGCSPHFTRVNIEQYWTLVQGAYLQHNLHDVLSKSSGDGPRSARGRQGTHVRWADGPILRRIPSIPCMATSRKDQIPSGNLT
jgi:hypothetical protein